MRWIQTTTEHEAASVHFGHWENVYTQTPNGMIAKTPGILIDGEFSTEPLKRVKVDPVKRIEIADKALPLPPACREIMIARRAMIREARWQGIIDGDIAITGPEHTPDAKQGFLSRLRKALFV